MDPRQSTDARNLLLRARILMLDALNILDGIEATGDIGSHLDLAIARLDRDLDASPRREFADQPH